MHELSIAQNIVETLERTARQNNATRVVSAVLKLGELTCIEPETLTFAFEVTAKGTAAEGCRLDIVRVPLRLRCDTCSWEGEMSMEASHCPSCAGETFKPTGGREIQLETMEIEET
jgi:hydrogenase nickel incorporation protein HypA/HybF